MAERSAAHGFVAAAVVTAPHQDKKSTLRWAGLDDVLTLRCLHHQLQCRPRNVRRHSSQSKVVCKLLLQEFPRLKQVQSFLLMKFHLGICWYLIGCLADLGSVTSQFDWSDNVVS